MEGWVSASWWSDGTRMGGRLCSRPSYTPPCQRYSLKTSFGRIMHPATPQQFFRNMTIWSSVYGTNHSDPKRLYLLLLNSLFQTPPPPSAHCCCRRCGGRRWYCRGRRVADTKLYLSISKLFFSAQTHSSLANIPVVLQMCKLITCMWCSDPFSFPKSVSLSIGLMHFLLACIVRRQLINWCVSFVTHILSLIMTHSLFPRLSEVSQLLLTPFLVLFLFFTVSCYLVNYQTSISSVVSKTRSWSRCLVNMFLDLSLGLHFTLTRWVTWSNWEVICISNLFHPPHPPPDHFLPSKARHFDVPQISLQPDYLTGEADFAALRHAHADEG